MATVTYYDEVDRLAFTANVIDIIEENGEVWVGLDESTFYAEAGGMLNDEGELAGQPVLDLKWVGDVLYHRLQNKVTGNISGAVEAKHRLIKTQIHTCQHLLSALMMKHYQLDTVGHHVHTQGADIVFDGFPEDPDWAQKIQDEANELIFKNLLVEIRYPSKEEAAKNDPSGSLDHDKIRAVIIPDIDYNLCGCLHVPNLNRIRGVVITSVSKSRGGALVQFVCGEQLLQYLSERNQLLNECSALLALPQMQVKQGLENLKQQLANANFEGNGWRLKYLDLWADSTVASLDLSKETIYVNTIDTDVKSLQHLASRMVRTPNLAVILQAKKEDGQAHVIVSRHPDFGSLKADEVFNRLKAEFGYKGGGNPNTAQGGGPYIENLTAWFQN